MVRILYIKMRIYDNEMLRLLFVGGGAGSAMNGRRADRVLVWIVLVAGRELSLRGSEEKGSEVRGGCVDGLGEERVLRVAYWVVLFNY